MKSTGKGYCRDKKHRIRKTPYKAPKRKNMHKTLARLNQDDIQSLYGVKFIAGIDECGTGAVCGPITMGITVLPVDKRLEVKDSKKYSSIAAREKAEELVLKQATFAMVTDVQAKYINEYGHARAWKEGLITLLKAIAARYNKADVVIIVDGKVIPELPPQFNNFRIIAVPKADENISAVSAASVIAKCSRDRDMIAMAQTGYYAPYGLDANMGYLTTAHREAILAYGPTSSHRTKAISSVLQLVHRKRL